MLKAESIGTKELVFQALGQITPITILGGLILGAAGFALGSTPLAFLIGMGAVLLAANTVYQFSRIVSHAGGYYAYVARGMGRSAGIFTGFQYVLYQVANLGLEFLIVIWGFSKGINYALGTNLPVWTGIIYMGAMTVLSFYFMSKGIKPSLRLVMFIGLIQLAAILIISLAVIGQAPDNTFTTFTPQYALGGWHGVFLGFIVGSYLSFAGYGSVVPMGEEARAPSKTIGRAVLYVVLLAGLVFVLGSYAMTVGYGISNMTGFVNAVIPGFQVTREYLGVGGVYLYLLAVTFISTYGTVVGMGTPLTRVTFALARDGALPGFLAKTDASGTPYNAVRFTFAVSVAFAALTGGLFWYFYGFYTGLYFAWAIFATIATLGTLLIHVLSNTSLSLMSIASKKWVLWLLVPTATSAIMMVAIYYSLLGITMPFLVAPIVVLAWVLFSIAYVYARRASMHSEAVQETNSTVPEA